jgi:hypothetical protein
MQEVSFRVRYDPKNNLIYILSGNQPDYECNVFRFIFLKNGKVFEEKIMRVPEVLISESLIDEIDRIEIFCKDRKLKEFHLEKKFFKTNRALLYDSDVALKDVALMEKDFFSYNVFFKEFKETALANREAFLKSMELLELLSVDRRLEFVYEGYKKFKEVKALEYLVENYTDFVSLVEYENFIKWLLESGDLHYRKQIIEKTFGKPSKRVFSLLVPYLSKSFELSEHFLTILDKQNKNHVYHKEALNFFVNVEDENNKFYEAYVTYGISHLDGEDKKAFVKKMLHTKKFTNFILPLLRNNIIDRDTAKYVLDNFSNIAKPVKEALYSHLFTNFKDKSEFYKLYLEQIPEMEEQVLKDVVQEGIKDEFFLERLLNKAREKPVPSYVLTFIEKGDVKNEAFYELIFTEPIIQREVMELMERHNKQLFKSKLFKILEDENNSLWEYAISKAELFKEEVDFMIKLYGQYKDFGKKVAVLSVLAKMGVKGEKFVLGELKDLRLLTSESIVRSLISYGSDDTVKIVWNLIDKRDKNIYLIAINALMDRGKPVLCDDLLNITVNEKDRELKFASFWAYIYSCEEGFLNNFELIVKDANEEFYKEVMSGFEDYLSLYSHLRERTKLKIKEILLRETNKEVIDMLKKLLN